ncbi:MAG: DNA polymerase III subunit delta' [Candidatus Omnitrophica bacterium]|nr:DNA polymerase III subunit delta' [Candidatus Omnitrophota bacterium]
MSFKRIKGQDKAIEILKEDLRQSRLGQGYLFAGPQGIGKKLVAKTLAKALNCQNETLDSCDSCASCLKIEKEQHPDVYIINASAPLDAGYEEAKSEGGPSTAIKIGHIRRLQKEISLRPYEARVKVFIIEDAHNLTAAASNALLKILEEPPANSLIILVSAKPALLFKTIISRCRVIKFYPLERKALQEILEKDYALEDNPAHFLAYFCEGRLGQALALKDTDIFSRKNSFIDTVTLPGRVDLESLSIKNRQEARDYLNILAGWFRDIYLVKTGASHLELVNLDKKSELLKLMPCFSFMDLDEIFSGIRDALVYLEQNINIRLLLSNLREEINYRLTLGQSRAA